MHGGGSFHTDVWKRPCAVLTPDTCDSSTTSTTRLNQVINPHILVEIDVNIKLFVTGVEKKAAEKNLDVSVPQETARDYRSRSCLAL